MSSSLLPSGSPDPSDPAKPLWHRDVSALAPQWADEAAEALALLAQSDEKMVQANAVGLDSQNAPVAYAALLSRMKELEQETLKVEKESWWDNLHRKFLGKKKPLVERMDELMRARQLLVDSSRQRIHGLREALDIRERFDEMAESLLERMPAIEALAALEHEQATEVMATVDREDFDAFRSAQMRLRAVGSAPMKLQGVRTQLQNALSLGAPLRDSLERFVHVEEMNQSQFELAFGAQISQLAVLQGMQQSKANATASHQAMSLLPSSSSTEATGNALLERLGQRRLLEAPSLKEKKQAEYENLTSYIFSPITKGNTPDEEKIFQKKLAYEQKLLDMKYKQVEAARMLKDTEQYQEGLKEGMRTIGSFFKESDEMADDEDFEDLSKPLPKRRTKF